MTFRGWPAEALDFYDGLVADNSKAYWTDHKAVYDEVVRAPMQALLDELEPEFGEGRIFRPYRDVRFSKDKTPYKTNIAAMVGPSSYVSLDVEGLHVGSGYYRMESDQVARYRAAVADDVTGAQLERALAEIEKKKIDVAGTGRLATVPRGYSKDHPRLDLLRNKGLTSWQAFPAGAWLGTAAAKKKVVDVLRGSRPLLTWLDDHVGPSAGREAS